MRHRKRRGLLTSLTASVESLSTKNEELIAENESLMARVEGAKTNLREANAALFEARSETEALGRAGEQLASVRAVLAAYTDICRAANSKGLTQLQSALVPHATQLAAMLIAFERSKSEEFGQLSFNRCDGLVRTTATTSIWVGEPECLGKWSSHVEVERLLLAVESLERAPVQQLVEDRAIASVRKVHLSEFTAMIASLRRDADVSRCMR